MSKAVIINKQYVVSAGSPSVPIVLEAGVVNGVYTWKIQIPLSVTYEGPNTKTIRQLLANVALRRASLEQNVNGLIINSLTLSRL